ncbi:MAG TPA: hypothetical protein VFM18_21770 [Methanosarcina sp.]|nr:hypothetical protein [Methanosarcina sp.]
MLINNQGQVVRFKMGAHIPTPYLKELREVKHPDPINRVKGMFSIEQRARIKGFNNA